MPKRNRTNEQRKTGVVVPVVRAAPEEDEVTRAAKMFAESVRAHEAADRAAQERKEAAARTARERADAEQAVRRQHGELVAAKDAAAARLKRLRADGRPRQQMAEAEGVYRAALAALQEHETGERPHWAPAPAAVPDAGTEQADEMAEDQPS